MRVHIQDFCGHPFQVQMSRELAGRGHEVLHTYATQYVTGRGNLEVTAEDPPGLRIEGITAGVEMKKYSPVGRLRFELSYAKAMAAKVAEFPADVVVLCNEPLLAATVLRRRFARSGQRWMLWHQDVISSAMSDEVGRKLPAAAAAPLQRLFRRLEKRVVAEASAVVAIGDQFVAQYREWGLPTDEVAVIHNWAPVDEIVPGDRDNDWSRRMLPPAEFRLLYAGTLGRKHDPLLLLDLLDSVRAHNVMAQLVVVSTGVGADMIREQAAGRTDVVSLDFQPNDVLPDVLASGDVLVALLEPDASRFSVPSKVCSYLAAGRPVLAVTPSDNPCAPLVRRGGGMVAFPDPSGVAEAAPWVAGLAGDRRQAGEIGGRARQVATTEFAIKPISEAFERMLHKAQSTQTVGDPGVVRADLRNPKGPVPLPKA
jgi:glycosyltransferase involved in cell wall biosynthesis